MGPIIASECGERSDLRHLRPVRALRGNYSILPSSKVYPGLRSFPYRCHHVIPANENGYISSKREHRYRADYVTPGSWVLNLSFVPEGLLGAPAGRFTLPHEITSFGWTVKQGGGPFLATVAATRSPFRLTTDVRVPEPGDYEITLRVNLADGTPEISTRNYRLRDFPDSEYRRFLRLWTGQP